MGLFRNRPLVIICSVGIILMALSTYLSKGAFLSAFITLTVLCCIGIISCIFMSVKKDYDGKIKVSILCATVFFLITLILTSRFQSFYTYEYGYAQSLNQNYCKINGIIEKVHSKYIFSSSYVVKVCEINGEKAKFNLLLESEKGSDFEPDDKIEFYGTINNFDENQKYLISQGISGKIQHDLTKEISYLGKAEKSFTSVFNGINEEIQEILNFYTDENAGKMSGAILLGNRENLNDSTVRDFRRCGISHMLALSGLHMSIVIGFFDFLLSKMRIDKKFRCFLLIFISFAYLAITGFSPSATRSMIMISSVYTAYLLSVNTDGITSLFVALTIILAVSPSSLYDMGLWMSFLATMGIIIANEITSKMKFRMKKKPLHERILIHTISVLSITFSAIIAVCAFSWLCFGEISLATPITNIIASPLITLILVMSLLIVIFSPVHLIASLIGFLLSKSVFLLESINSYFSNISGISVSMKYDFVPFIIVPMILATFVLLVIKIKHKWTLAIPALTAICAFIVCLNVYTAKNSEDVKAVYLRDKNSEMLVISDAGKASICDLSSGGFGNFYNACQCSFDNCHTEIENIILTHYHKYHGKSLKKMTERYIVRNIYLPKPETNQEIEYLKSMSGFLENCNSNLIIYDRGSGLISSVNVNISVSKPDYIERSKHPIFSLTVSNNTDSLTYYCSGILETENFRINNSNHFIFGSHGASKRPIINQNNIFSDADVKTVLFGEAEEILKDKDFLLYLNEIQNSGVKIITRKIEKYEFNFESETARN